MDGCGWMGVGGCCVMDVLLSLCFSIIDDVETLTCISSQSSTST